MKISYTIYNTPFLKGFFHFLGMICFKLTPWKIEGELPEKRRFVMIAFPHTTNWDMPITMTMAFAYRAELYWFGKDTLFRFPFGSFMRWMGGIPIDRRQSNNAVDLAADLFAKYDNLILTIPPEGTRKEVPVWKTGFYYIALKAQVPIVCGFLDYKRKVAGIGPVVYPTGNLAEDMNQIIDFYKGVQGKYPHKMPLLEDF
jgi:1-acyl-sn-glycerol-3-phosphate acyltransferase